MIRLTFGLVARIYNPPDSPAVLIDDAFDTLAGNLRKHGKQADAVVPRSRFQQQIRDL